MYQYTQEVHDNNKQEINKEIYLIVHTTYIAD
jgi:hypothetical protein